mgnify:FL=1
MKYFFVLFYFILSITNLYSQSESTIYVSPSGKDDNDGSQDLPLKTITKALSQITNGNIILLDGVYREEVLIDGKKNITIKGSESGNAVIDGTVSLQEYSWTNSGNNIFYTTTDTAIWQLFTDGKEMVMARWPNAQFTDKSIYSWDTWAEGDEGNSANGLMTFDNNKSFYSALDGDLDTAHSILNVGSFRTWNRKIDFSAGADYFTYDVVPNGQYKNKHHYFYVEGDLDLLDTLNEWYHNPTTGELWVMTDGDNPSGMDILSLIHI